MATLQNARAIANALPDVLEKAGSTLSWSLADQPAFAWERPFRKSDLKRFLEPPPAGDILAVRVASLAVKEQMLSDPAHPYLFTIPHFDGYPAVLLYLEDIGVPELETLLAKARQSSLAAQKTKRKKIG